MSLTGGLIAAAVVGVTHAAAHYTFGDPDSFASAGVNRTGIAVTLVAFAVGLIFI
jgi:hypothetical protein